MEKIPRNKKESRESPPSVKLYKMGTWEDIKDSILLIEQSAFGEKAFTMTTLENIFENESYRNILLRSSAGELIGFTCAFLDPESKNAHIENTVITQSQQGKGLVGILITEIEDVLRKEGMRTMSRAASVENGYADKIQKYYGDRIITQGTDKKSPWGLQRYFVIKL